MIKAAAEGFSGRCVILGLNKEELGYLLAGKSVRLNLRTVGVEAELFLMGGETDESIQMTLSQAVPTSTVNSVEELEIELSKG